MDARYYACISEALLFHRIITSADELTDETFEDLIIEFQQKSGLILDGYAGPETLWAMQYPMVQSQGKMKTERCTTDLNNDETSAIVLRADAASQFKSLYSAVKSNGGILCCQDSKCTNELPRCGHSSHSLHYAGLAFDLSYTAGFFRPATDSFVITRTEQPGEFWTVWCKAPAAPEVTLDAVYWDNRKSGVDKTLSVTGNYLNFTELCRINGFYPRNPRRPFLRPNGRIYESAEWWHFQANDALVPGFSLFGIELLKIEGYTEEFLAQNNIQAWEYRKSIFGVDWL
jgi:hypothetical protein